MHKEIIKKNKKTYYQTELGKSTSKRNRDKRKDKHLAYCRTDKYRALKKQRDEIYLSKKKYGEYWECMIICKKIEQEVIALVPDKLDRLKMRGIIKRSIIKRAYKRHLLYGWKFNY